MYDRLLFTSPFPLLFYAYTLLSKISGCTASPLSCIVPGIRVASPLFNCRCFNAAVLSTTGNDEQQIKVIAIFKRRLI
jgi:hypothetical protein